jgi:hypothetical protein
MFVEIIVFGLWMVLLFALLEWLVGAGLMAGALTSYASSSRENPGIQRGTLRLLPWAARTHQQAASGQAGRVILCQKAVWATQSV